MREKSIVYACYGVMADTKIMHSHRVPSQGRGVEKLVQKKNKQTKNE